MQASRMGTCLAAIVAAMLARPLPGWTQTSAGNSLYNHPQLDAITLALIYDKISNIQPDFRIYAQQSTAYINASVFGRDKVLADAMASLQKRFATLDVHGIYVARLSVPLEQYDPTSQAYGVGFGESSYVPFTDPVTYQRYGVQFTNRAAIEKIPMASDEAETYAHRFNLPISGSYVGNAVLQMAFRIDAVPPSVRENETMVDATIVTARIYTNDGRFMHDFAVVAQPTISSARANILKAADIQGLKLTMPIDAVISAGKAGWTKQIGSPDEGVILFFNGLEQRKLSSAMIAGLPNPYAHEWAICAGEQSGRQNPDDRIQGVGPPFFGDCIAIAAKAGSITRISSQQRLSNVDLTALKAQLDAKYGTPVQIANEGNDRIWVGHDPADSNGEEVKIEAAINTIMTPTVLTITLTYYERASAKAPPTRSTSAPKL